jgi:hypothetical protein
MNSYEKTVNYHSLEDTPSVLGAPAGMPPEVLTVLSPADRAGNRKC